MTNTIRARKNAATKAASLQTKTSRRVSMAPVSKFQAKCIKAAGETKIRMLVPGAGEFPLSEKCETAIRREVGNHGYNLKNYVGSKTRPFTETSELADFVIPDTESHPACLAVFCRDSGTPISKIPLSESEFFDLINRSIMSRTHLDDFVAGAIRKKMAAPADDGFSNLERTCAKVEGLLQLLADKFEHLAEVDGNEFNGEAVKHFVAGVGYLVADAQKSLQQSFATAYRAAHPGETEVVS